METQRRRGVQIDVETLRGLRNQHALRLEDLAQRADRSMATIHNAERGKLVDVSTLAAIAKALGVEPNRLLKGELTAVELEYQSAFISYGGPDETFAKLVFEALKANDIKTFFFPESSVPGERLHRTMSQGVLEYDRVILICSKSSLVRPGVLNEIEQVLIREASEGGSEILIPITLDDFLFTDWKPEKADVGVQIRARVVADFRGAIASGVEFDARFKRILRALEIKA